ncbi:hypothetical protein ACFW81_24185 [Streptomyces angustmyceticus]|uniref:hypothetical protein n=1 Tax=Streptomyces angustmyceticus TaxID=285578 RepID=UPI0036A4CB3E
MSTPDELRARASELENRVPPAAAGPRTDDERMWLEKAAALRAEAARLETAEQAGHAVDQGLAKLFTRLGAPQTMNEDDNYEDFGFDEEVPDNYCPFHPSGGCKPETTSPTPSSEDTHHVSTRQ